MKLARPLIPTGLFLALLLGTATPGMAKNKVNKILHLSVYQFDQNRSNGKVISYAEFESSSELQEYSLPFTKTVQVSSVTTEYPPPPNGTQSVPDSVMFSTIFDVKKHYCMVYITYENVVLEANLSTTMLFSEKPRQYDNERVYLKQADGTYLLFFVQLVRTKGNCE